MRHVYVHVPFCARRCSYCDFAIAVRRSIPGPEFVRVVETERRIREAQGEAWDVPLETLYLGGGTPSMLAPGDLARLVDGFSLAPDAEVTLEANPDDVSPRAASAWARAGITRVSLGAQSFQDRVLRWMHRTHTAQATSRAVALLRDAGLADLSLDLIFGLPRDVEHDWSRDLDRALALNPGHLSVYGLTVEPRTPLARWIARGMHRPLSDDQFRQEFLLAHRVLRHAGFVHYEVSNYARDTDPPARARHNSAYWNGALYRGLGPSAHGFDGCTRRWNVREWALYRRVANAGVDPVEGREILTPAQRHLERTYLGLRTDRGIPQRSIDTENTATLAAIDRGWLTLRDGRLFATAEGWLVLDDLVPRLTTSGEGG